MRPKIPVRTRSAIAATTLGFAAVFLGALAPEAAAAQPFVPVQPFPTTGAGPLVSEVGNVEGPLFHDLPLLTKK